MEEENNFPDNELNNTNSQTSNWLEKGKSLMYPDRFEEWESCVEARANGIYNGKDLDIALEIMNKLESGDSLWNARQFFEEQENSQGFHAMVSQIIFAFSKQGPEFLEYIMDGEVSPETQKAIDAKKKENLKLSIIYNKHTNNTTETTDTANTTENTLNNDNTENTTTETTSITTDTNIQEKTNTNSNNYLQIRKENIFTKIVTFIKRVFFSRKYKDIKEE